MREAALKAKLRGLEYKFSSEVSKLAYVAGIVDGEGSIVMANNKARRCIQLAVRVRVIDSILIEWLHENFGGSVLAPHKGWKSKRPILGWAVYSNRAHQFLMAIRPYLVIRKNVADALVDYPISTMQERFEMRRKVMSANQRTL